MESESTLSKRTLIIIGVITAVTIITVAIIAATIIETTNEGCSIDLIKDFTNQHPLILDENKNEFILPNIKNGINFSKGQTLRLSCPGQNNHIQISTVNEITITCVANNTFTVNDGNLGERNFKDLRCVTYPEPTTIRSGKKCSETYSEIQIGFKTNKGFVVIMTNCLDETKKDSLYSVFNLTSKIKSQQIIVPRPKDFIEGNFYEDIYPSTLYERTSERTALQRILKSTNLAAKYISLDNDFFLSRGHLTAKVDFVYGSQQRATFFYINVAPQWQTFNGGNWNEAEKSCRNYVHQRKLDLTVYTGIYGQSTLPDLYNNQRNISLFVDNNNSKQLLTIPEIFWKVLHDPISKRAVVLVGHNNPYNKNVIFICNDVSRKLNWLLWDAKNVTTGISYCCNFAEFKRVVNYVPDIQVNGLLT